MCVRVCGREVWVCIESEARGEGGACERQGRGKGESQEAGTPRRKETAGRRDGGREE